MDQQQIVFSRSQKVPSHSPPVKGPDFSSPTTLSSLLSSYSSIGFQATNLAKAITTINQMLDWRDNDNNSCTIFLGYTSNLVSSGLRDIFAYLARHKLVQTIVTTAGGIEEDIIKCFAPTHIGSFSLDGHLLREKGHNRIGNLIIPNDNYCMFESWLLPILFQMHNEKNHWTPSEIIWRLGKEVNNEESIYYWAYKHQIPVYCPGIIDGSFGDIVYFYSVSHPGFVIDLVPDLVAINHTAAFAKATGMVILGGGIVKHHIANANLMRNGAEFSVFVNSGIEYDGSDSGASPDEAVSWGKVKDAGTKVWGDATIIFPLIVAESFAKKAPRGEDRSY